jgi:hypothetical protein
MASIVAFKKDAGETTLVRYTPEFRAYGLILPKEYPFYYSIAFCPWCGKNFPKDLNELWCKEASRALNQDADEGIDFNAYQRLPEKYKTEEWWRELGL